MKAHYYAKNIGDLKRRLRDHLDPRELKELHRIRTGRHFAVLARQLLLFAGCAVVLAVCDEPWIWIPVAVLQGFNILGFIILLHEQVHSLIFRGRHPWLERWLGLAYALPSALSATQFKIWHLDHHRELGSDADDPKRAHLSPKLNSRLLKLLYFTPALFVIYAIAAAREARCYSDSECRIIRWERIGNIGVHLLVASALYNFGGLDVLCRVHLVPLLMCFPPAFVLNRLGQHYDIEPDEPAAWSTLVNGNPVWRFIFLWSNHHLEHHYYPAVPFYNLLHLNRKLQPFFAATGIENRTYGQLLNGWLVRNCPAHSHWDLH